MTDSTGSRLSQLSCKRCGGCCRNGGPALHTEDLSLVKSETISLTRLVTVRRKEPAFDQKTRSIGTDRGEFVKVSGSGGSWTCCFWQESESSCGIYGERPLECRLLFCEDTRAIENVMGHSLLTREDIVGSENDIMAAIRKHELLYGYNQMNTLVSEFMLEPSLKEKLKEINRLVREDFCYRNKFFTARPDLIPMEMFIFGRPFFLVLAPYGFRVLETYNGLTVEYCNDHESSQKAVAI